MRIICIFWRAFHFPLGVVIAYLYVHFANESGFQIRASGELHMYAAFFILFVLKTATSKPFLGQLNYVFVSSSAAFTLHFY